MRIKTKLSLGLGFLFLLFGVVGGLGAYYINLLAGESNQIIADNYRSVQYTRAMLGAVAEMQRFHTELFFRPVRDSLTTAKHQKAYGRALVTFAQNLAAAQRNITEAGEGEMMASLRRHWSRLREIVRQLPAGRAQPPAAYYFTELAPAGEKVRADIAAIEAANLKAINRKNAAAQRTAKEVLTSITLAGVIAFLAYFVFLFVFPDCIAGPIQELSQSIGQIANKNYGQRLHFRSDDEFGEVAAAFNLMARKLDEYEHSNLAEIMFEKKRLDTVINNMHDAITGLDEGLHILFMNQQATHLLNLKEAEVVDEYAPDLARGNNLMQHLLEGLVPPGKAIAGGTPLKTVAGGKESYFNKEVIEVEFTRAGETTSRTIGYVITLKNITQFKELDAAKTNFIATISHELKTPISTINMSLRLLEDRRVGNLNEEQQHLVNTIKAEAQRLLGITGELLDLTQVETGNIQLHCQVTKPGEIINYACPTFTLTAKRRPG